MNAEQKRLEFNKSRLEYNRNYRKTHKESISKQKKEKRSKSEFKLKAKEYREKKKDEYLKYQQLWRSLHPNSSEKEIPSPKQKINAQKRHLENKLQAYHMINKDSPLICANCGQDNLDFLTIDHSLNNGKDHRKKFGSGTGIYRAIINGKIPEEELKTLRIYCYNCNMSRQRTKN